MSTVFFGMAILGAAHTGGMNIRDDTWANATRGVGYGMAISGGLKRGGMITKVTILAIEMIMAGIGMAGAGLHNSRMVCVTIAEGIGMKVPGLLIHRHGIIAGVNMIQENPVTGEDFLITTHHHVSLAEDRASRAAIISRSTAVGKASRAVIISRSTAVGKASRAATLSHSMAMVGKRKLSSPNRSDGTAMLTTLRKA